MRRRGIGAGQAVALLTASGLAAAGLVWWRLRSQREALPVEPEQEDRAPFPIPPATAPSSERFFFDALDEPPPSSDYVSPASNPAPITAQPMPHAPSLRSADDWDTVEPEEMGEAFLHRATESTTEPNEDDEDARLLEVWKTGL